MNSVIEDTIVDYYVRCCLSCLKKATLSVDSVTIVVSHYLTFFNINLHKTDTLYLFLTIPASVNDLEYYLTFLCGSGGL